MRARCRDIEAAWFEVGRGSPIILVHGLADDHRLWRLMLPELCLGHRVVLVDVRGHGQSTAGRGAGTLRQLGDDLVDLMDVIGLQRTSIAGYSLGGTVAMRVAIDHPERVHVIFPIATSSRVGRSVVSWYTERAEKPDDELRRMIDRDTVEQYQLAPGELEAALRMRREATVHLAGYRNGCRAMARLHQEPLDAELAQIKAPTLVISADLDQHCPPRAGEIITEAIPGASMEVVAGSAHPIPIQKPEVLVTLIENFLREAAAA